MDIPFASRLEPVSTGLEAILISPDERRDSALKHTSSGMGS